jgi:hypothetical protein
VVIYLGNEEDLESTMKVVDIDISKTPFENAKHYYDLRANFTEKEKKTMEATNAILKQAKDAAEKKIKKKEEHIKAVKINRKAQWYEKFYWFVSSENYLVISAKDAHQNETIIKKYLAKDDAVFHTQVQGSAFSLVKNPYGGPIPHQTLQEAAQATLSHSRCWDQKVVTEVFWVNAEQVSKTAPTGQFVGLGSFMIYGKKNFITPARLEMGFGLFFKVDEESAKNHVGERKRRDEGNEIEEDDSQRLIRVASEVVVTPKDQKRNLLTEDKPKPKEEMDEEKKGDENDINSAEQNDSEDIDIDDRPSQAPTSKLGSSSLIERSITIGKDTECTFIKNTISSGKTMKSQQDQKKKARQDKKAGIQPKKDDKAPTKAQPEPLSKQLSKNKKNRMKKMAEKYGEMDEEERMIQMQMLGAKSLKLTSEQQKMLDKKMKEGRVGNMEDETEKDVIEEVEESSEEEVAPKKGAKGKGKDGKDAKSDNKKGAKPEKSGGKQQGKPEKGGKQAQTSQKAKDSTATKKPDATTKGISPKPSAKSDQDVKPTQESTLSGLTDPQGEASDSQKPQNLVMSEDKIEDKTANQEDEGEEEMEDLVDDLGDNDDGPEDEAMEAKKETMSVINTVLDEDAEKNLNDALEFKDYSGIPKNNGRLPLTQTCSSTACLSAHHTMRWLATSTASSSCREP